MTEERTRVLRMLVTGTLTVEQANQLLGKLGEQPEPWDEVVPVQQLDDVSD
jgi:hypothetical protein